MNSVKVKRSELLTKVKENAEKHRELFLQAQEGYREIVIAQLDQILKDAREGRNIKRGISIPEPQDHTQAYEAIIAMLEMSVEDVIELDYSSFQQYVLDNWVWKNAAII